MKRNKFIKELEKNCAKAVDIVKLKNSDYADDSDPFKNFRLVEYTGLCSIEEGILVRISDKLQRVINLLHRENKVKDESIEDSILDMMNYLNILLVYLKSKR